MDTRVAVIDKKKVDRENDIVYTVSFYNVPPTKNWRNVNATSLQWESDFVFECIKYAFDNDAEIVVLFPEFGEQIISVSLVNNYVDVYGDDDVDDMFIVREYIMFNDNSELYCPMHFQWRFDMATPAEDTFIKNIEEARERVRLSKGVLKERVVYATDVLSETYCALVEMR